MVMKKNFFLLKPVFQTAFTIYSSSEFDEKRGCEKNIFFLRKDTEDLSEVNLKVQFQIKILSVSNEWLETTDTGKYAIEQSIPVHLFTVVKENDTTLIMSDKKIHIFQSNILFKCHFTFFISSGSDPGNEAIVSPQSSIFVSDGTPKKHCNVCADYKSIYDSKDMADITIILEDKSFLAHKLVLTTRSPVFRAMLRNCNFGESSTKTIQIIEIDSFTFDYFLKYLYCGEIQEKSYDIVRNLYMLADKYEVDGLKEECRDLLIADVNIDTVCDLLKLSNLLTDETMKQGAVKFIKHKFREVSKQAEWKKICKDYPDLASDVLSMIMPF